MRNILLILLLFCILPSSPAQDLYVPSANGEIDLFLDELAAAHFIHLNSVIKPYSQVYILQKLSEASCHRAEMNSRQLRQLYLYMKCYIRYSSTGGALSANPVSLYIRRSIPSEGVNPADPDLSGRSYGYFNPEYHMLFIGVVPLVDEKISVNEYGVVNKSEIGAGISGNIRNLLSFSFSILKGFQSERLAGPNMFTPEPGERWNSFSNGSGDYIDWTGQVMVSWKWGSFGIIKERFTWGNNYHGATIFSGKPPSFPHIRLHVKPAKWIEFNFISGILRSGVVDSNRTIKEGDGSRTYYRQKYMSANLVTFIPWRYLNISLGNSVIYGDKFEPAYTIPVLFYKSIDHTLSPEPGLTGGTNAQMFLDISSRQIRHLHLYLTLFIDEFKISRISSRSEHNFLGWKGGFRLSDFPLENLSFTAEGTRTLPLTYQHNVIITTYESDGFNLGNSLRDNSREIFFRLEYRPLGRLCLALSYIYSWHGDNFVYATEPNPTTVPVFRNMTWQNRSWVFVSSWSLAGNANLFLSYENSLKKGDVIFNSPSFQGGTNTVSAGVRVGF